MLFLFLLSCDGSDVEQLVYNNPIDTARTEFTYKAVATIIDDDIGSVEAIEGIKEMADRQNIKITFAAITDKLNDVNKNYLLLKYQTEGFHIVSHSQSHNQNIWRKGYSDFDTIAIRNEMEKSLGRLKYEGYTNCDFLVYPYGQFPEDNNVLNNIMTLASGYYRAAVNSSTGKANYPGNTSKYYLNRILISRNRNIEELKITIDKEIASNGWMIFLTHSNNSNEFDVNYMEQIVEYILSKNVSFMTLEEAWRHKGHLYK